MVTSKSAEVGDRILKVTFCFILMEEIWKDVVGYEGLYMVSNFGRVKSIDVYVPSKANSIRKHKGKIRSNCYDGNYYHVCLYKKGKRKISLVHRLVCEAFVPNPKNLPQVNHIDGNKLNNNAQNLEWCTASENIQHAFRNGLCKPQDGGTSKKILAYKTSGEFVGEFKSLHQAERDLGVNIGHIWCVLNNREKSSKGYIFKYK